MREAADYVRKLLGYDPKHANHISRMINMFGILDGLKAENYKGLIIKVENKEECEDFLRKTQLPFEDLIFTFHHIFRWVLPHSLHLRELIDKENESNKNHMEELRTDRIRFNPEQDRCKALWIH